MLSAFITFQETSEFTPQQSLQLLIYRPKLWDEKVSDHSEKKHNLVIKMELTEEQNFLHSIWRQLIHCISIWPFGGVPQQGKHIFVAYISLKKLLLLFLLLLNVEFSQTNTYLFGVNWLQSGEELSHGLLCCGFVRNSSPAGTFKESHGNLRGGWANTWEQSWWGVGTHSWNWRIGSVQNIFFYYFYQGQREQNY